MDIDIVGRLLDNQNKLCALMIEAYEQRKIPNWYVYRPYFEWKQKKICDIPSETLLEMRSVTYSALQEYDAKYPDSFDHINYEDTDNLFYLYEGYGKDKETVAFLDIINEDITNLLILRSM